MFIDGGCLAGNCGESFKTDNVRADDDGGISIDDGGRAGVGGDTFIDGGIPADDGTRRNVDVEDFFCDVEDWANDGDDVFNARAWVGADRDAIFIDDGGPAADGDDDLGDAGGRSGARDGVFIEGGDAANDCSGGSVGEEDFCCGRS